MKVGATADLHGYLPDIPDDLDLLLIAGDIGVKEDLHLESFPGIDRKLMHLEEWLHRIDCEVVAIAGNHDFGLAGVLGDSRARSLPWTYLLDETVQINGLTIHGSPWTPTYGNWAFMQDDEELARKWALIPDDVDILITHGPPFGVMDVGHGGVPAGSETLRQRLTQIDPVLHIFGHIHGSRGVRWHDTNYLTANVAYVDEAYQPLEMMTFEL